MPKIIFLDVDGTLVDYEGNLPQSAVKAIRAVRKNGHKVYICTGRSKAEIYQNIWNIGLDGMIGANGAYVEHEGSVLLHQSLSRDTCRKAIAWLGARGLEFYLESNSGLFASEQFETARRCRDCRVCASERKQWHDRAQSLPRYDFRR